jgi:hypothetical protein
MREASRWSGREGDMRRDSMGPDDHFIEGRRAEIEAMMMMMSSSKIFRLPVHSVQTIKGDEARAKKVDDG